VLLDALIVRSVLVPSLMLLFGPANWRLPAFLERILPHFRIEGEAAAGTAATADPGAPPGGAVPEPSAV
jgi:putative drug exporter of the RND superfamily